VIDKKIQDTLTQMNYMAHEIDSYIEETTSNELNKDNEKAKFIANLNKISGLVKTSIQDATNYLDETKSLLRRFDITDFLEKEVDNQDNDPVVIEDEDDRKLEELPRYEKYLNNIDSILEEAQSKFNASEKEAFRSALNEHVNNFNFIVQTGAPPFPTEWPNDNLYINRTNNETAFDWLKKHYTPWLKCFSPNLISDALFQDELKETDPDLYKALRSQNQNILKSTKLKLQDIIPSGSVRNDRLLANSSELDIKRARQLINALNYRNKNSL